MIPINKLKIDLKVRLTKEYEIAILAQFQRFRQTFCNAIKIYDFAVINTISNPEEGFKPWKYVTISLYQMNNLNSPLLLWSDYFLTSKDIEIYNSDPLYRSNFRKVK